MTTATLLSQSRSGAVLPFGTNTGIQAVRVPSELGAELGAELGFHARPLTLSASMPLSSTVAALAMGEPSTVSPCKPPLTRCPRQQSARRSCMQTRRGT